MIEVGDSPATQELFMRLRSAIVPWYMKHGHRCSGQHGEGDFCPVAADVLGVLMSSAVYQAAGAMEIDRASFLAYAAQVYEMVAPDAVRRQMEVHLPKPGAPVN